MGGQLVKFDFQVVHVTGSVVAFQDAVGNCFLCRFLLCYLSSGFGSYPRRRILIIRNDLCAVYKIGTAF